MSDEPLPALFAEACELDDDGRAALLARLERDDPSLARELRRLLDAARSDRSPVDRLPWEGLAAALEPPAAPARIGPYRIVRELGRGGVGRVFLAEEEREAFQRTVALKLVDRSPADPDTLRRFRDEVRILAALDHPGIARLLDGGRTDDGNLFLALEYVDGTDLVRWARERSLPIAERLELFVAVLEAVAAAHERGVVHRDLKPDHLRIGRDGRPRLLDFGISKFVDPEAGEEATVTRTEARLLTPAYASPEQLQGRPAGPVSDIFSLGVVLYELIAGRRPFGGDGATRSQLEREVIEREPLPPCAIAVRQNAGDPTKVPTLPPVRRRGDLDAICLKALRKRPEDRYASVEAFAADLRHYVAGRPVRARRGARRHRLASWAARHRAPALAVAALIAAGVALAAVAFRDARPTRAFGPPPSPLSGDEGVEELERRLAAEPTHVEAGARLAEALVRSGRGGEADVVLGRLRQIPGAGDDPRIAHAEAVVATHLDQPQRALVHATRALEGVRAGRSPELLARVLLARARSLSDLGRRREAHDELLRGRAAAEALGDKESLAIALNDLAIDELTQGNLVDGERLLKAALLPARATGNAARVALILDNLGGIESVRGRPDLAVERYREAASAQRTLGRRRRAAIAEGGLADALDALGRGDEAAAVRDAAIAELTELGDETSRAYLLFARALVAVELGRHDAARRDVDVLAAASRASGNRTGLALSEELTARLDAATGDLVAARDRFESALRLYVADGNLDLASSSELAWAAAELEAGFPDHATARVDAALERISGGSGSVAALRAEALRLRIDAARGTLDRAADRLERLARDVDATTALAPRVALGRAAEALEEAATIARDDDLRERAGAILKADRDAGGNAPP